jgi:DNA (cytosine-5-)-methyltransferase
MTSRIFTYANPQITANGRQLRQNMTLAEQRLWQHLRGKRLAGYKFRRQQPLGTYILDFVCLEAKLVIEIDGGQHAEQTTYDAQRSHYLQQHGLTVLRFWNNEVLQQTEAVLTAILYKLEGQNAQ